MKLGKKDVPYAPYVAIAVEQIDEDDIVDGVLTLPKKASIFDEQSLMPRTYIKTIVIPNTNYQINSNKIIKKMELDFVLVDGTELDSLFCDVKASKITLPNTLKLIKNPGFRGSQIDELEIPSNVEELGDDIFKNATIKKLVVNERALSKISAKHILTNGTKTTILIKNDSDKIKQYIVPKLDINSILSFGYIDEAIDMFVNSLFVNKANDDVINKLKNRLKIKLLRTLKIKLLFGHDEEISINALALHDRKFNKLLKGIANDINVKTVPPEISSDGFTILKNDEKIKMLSLKEYLDNRY